MQKVSIEQVKTSKINQVDFDNLDFGNVFTDHMLVCDYRNGTWEAPKIMPYQAISLDPSAKIFHYGQSIFEGMKAYKDADDQVWLFRPLDNHKRLNISANRMAIPELPEDYFSKSYDNLNKVLSNSGVAYSRNLASYILQLSNPSLSKRTNSISSAMRKLSIISRSSSREGIRLESSHFYRKSINDNLIAFLKDDHFDVKGLT